MKYRALGLALALAACGQGGQGGQNDGGAISDTCPLVADAAAVFGEGAQVTHGGPLDAIADSCDFLSADGARGGDVITFTAESLGAITLEAKLSEVLASWDAMTETPLAPIESLGPEARMATDLPGYQTQVAFRRGDTLVLISARSGDDAVSGQDLAIELAEAAAASLPAAQ
jgi:hypothetical protein